MLQINTHKVIKSGNVKPVNICIIQSPLKKYDIFVLRCDLISRDAYIKNKIQGKTVTIKNSELKLKTKMNKQMSNCECCQTINKRLNFVK